MKLFLSSFLFTALLSSASYAQESCKVLMPAISGGYEGECKKGKADGAGKAQGTDTYTGEFRSGLPNGKGVYQWANGDVYDGIWSNGKREGTGDMTFKKAGRPDSVVTGFWKKDAYVGKFEKPYKVLSRSLQVAKADVKFTPSPAKEIIILVSNTTGNMPGLHSVGTKAVLSDVSIAKGSYTRLINLYERNKVLAYKLEQVNFPFRAKFRVGNQDIDVEFMEAGEFVLDINLNN
ncbi:hypothetical protein GZH53_13090 [Flavihumibacter sp. R14]|nr:hypothetical protein [Flavihumibacter soli]